MTDAHYFLVRVDAREVVLFFFLLVCLLGVRRYLQILSRFVIGWMVRISFNFDYNLPSIQSQSEKVSVRFATQRQDDKGKVRVSTTRHNSHDLRNNDHDIACTTPCAADDGRQRVS